MFRRRGVPAGAYEPPTSTADEVFADYLQGG